jgi:hypothetical protein
MPDTLGADGTPTTAGAGINDKPPRQPTGPISMTQRSAQVVGCCLKLLQTKRLKTTKRAWSP